ncbi:MAG: TetR/AcrR family transcriptional regulator [Actinomycetota bacterium]
MSELELDPRVERSRRVIGDATLELLAEVGYGALTVEGVAKRAGVGKSTIYRHWESKLDLVTDAIATLKPPVDDDPTPRPFRERVERHLRGVRDVLADSRWARVLPAVIDAAVRHDEVARWHTGYAHARRRTMTELLAEGVADGSLPADADVELLGDLLLGPIFLRRLMLREHLDDETIAAAVRAVLGDGTGAR